MITLLFIVLLVVISVLFISLKLLSKYDIVEADLEYHVRQPYYTPFGDGRNKKTRDLTKEEKRIKNIESEHLEYRHVSYNEKKEPVNIFAKINERFSSQLKECSAWLMAGLIVILMFSGLTCLTESNNIKKRDYLINYSIELNEEVEKVVNTFIEYEGITFENDVSLESLVITYPELRSVELVNNQLITLKQTKESIKDYDMKLLKYETIDKLFKFWR